mmetsp:Transcript_347/g.1131  ORF Transcript_347/g.1131 Transcript_347/m.1131 type:complete len:308 (+) Transcript_347:253-1176(+)
MAAASSANRRIRPSGKRRAAERAAAPESWIGLCSSERERRAGCDATAAASARQPSAEMKLQPSESCSRWRFPSSAAPSAASASTEALRTPDSASFCTRHSSPASSAATNSKAPRSPPPDWPRSTSRREATGASPPPGGFRLSAAVSETRSSAAGSSAAPDSGLWRTSLRSRTAGWARRRSSGDDAPSERQSAVSTRRSSRAAMTRSSCSGVHEPTPTLVPLRRWMVRWAMAALVTADLVSRSQPAMSSSRTSPRASRPSVSCSSSWSVARCGSEERRRASRAHERETASQRELETHATTSWSTDEPN